MDANEAACDNLAVPPSLRLILAAALFATGGALLKMCEFPSLQRAGTRAAIAALTIFILLPAARRLPNARILRLVPAYFGATCLFVVANSLTTAANAIFLQSPAPLWLALLAPWLLREPLTRRDLFVLAGVGTGMALCFAAPTEAVATAPDPRLGDWFAIASGISWAFLLLGMRWLARQGHDEAPAAIAWSNVFTLPLALALMPLVGQTPTAGSVQDWVVITVLGTLQMGVAYSLLIGGIAGVPAFRASLLLMIEPALNPAIAYLVHGERPHALVIAGGTLILGTVTANSVIGRARAQRGVPAQ